MLDVYIQARRRHVLQVVNPLLDDANKRTKKRKTQTRPCQKSFRRVQVMMTNKQKAKVMTEQLSSSWVQWNIRYHKISYRRALLNAARPANTRTTWVGLVDVVGVRGGQTTVTDANGYGVRYLDPPPRQPLIPAHRNPSLISNAQDGC